MQTKESDFSVCFKDDQDRKHSITVRAHSHSHAIILAMEEVHSLKLHPNLISRVTQETNQ